MPRVNASRNQWHSASAPARKVGWCRCRRRRHRSPPVWRPAICVWLSSASCRAPGGLAGNRAHVPPPAPPRLGPLRRPQHGAATLLHAAVAGKHLIYIGWIIAVPGDGVVVLELFARLNG